jgi:dTDP-4-amino-4,6-dideoxygalactose transaminase
MKIPFNKSPITPKSSFYITQALSKKTSGDGEFTHKCTEWLENQTNATKILLTTSCTHALEIAARLCGIKADDEVIMPSYTFSSTANAFVACGAKIVFIDIRPDTMNIDESLIESAITEKTRAIVPVHYAGVSCKMDLINEIAKKYNLRVVEDAAQGVMSKYKDKALGSFGDFGCFSFHETKKSSMGEGGALIIRNAENILEAEVMREKGTNRSRFFRGEIDKYSWVDWGSSYLPSDLNAAYLWSQLEIADDINNARIDIWNKYYSSFISISQDGLIELPYVPQECKHNAHMFYIKVKDNNVQSDLINFLNSNGINAIFHYVPLHSSEGGKKFGRFHGIDKYTTKESSRLIRLPLYYSLSEDDVMVIVEKVNKFFRR